MKVAKKRIMFAIYTTPTSKSPPKTNGLPIQYKKFQDMLKKNNGDTLPQHLLYNCAIELQEGAQVPFGPIYSLSQNELAALQEYIDKNLAKNFI